MIHFFIVFFFSFMVFSFSCFCEQNNLIIIYQASTPTTWTDTRELPAIRFLRRNCKIWNCLSPDVFPSRYRHGVLQKESQHSSQRLATHGQLLWCCRCPWVKTTTNWLICLFTSYIFWVYFPNWSNQKSNPEPSSSNHSANRWTTPYTDFYYTLMFLK